MKLDGLDDPKLPRFPLDLLAEFKRLFKVSNQILSQKILETKPHKIKHSVLYIDKAM